MFHKALRTAVWSLSIALVALGALAANVLMLNALGPFVANLHIAVEPRSLVLLEFCFVLALWTLTIVLHEGGHLLAARLQGMTVSELKLGWFVLTPRWRGYKFEFRRRGSMFGGMVKATVGSRSVRREMILFVLGGPAMNLVCGFIFSVATWLAFVHTAITLAGACFAVALANVYMGLANLLPVGRRIPSDGSRLYHWIFKGNKDPGALALMRLMGLSVKGLRARDYDAEDLKLLENSSMPLRRFLGGWLRMRGALDRGDHQAALAVHEQYRAACASLSETELKSVAGTWALCVMEAAYIQARFDKLPDAARRELDADTPKHLPAYFRLRLEAAMCYATGDLASAREHIASARVALDESHDIGTRLEEIDMLDGLSTLVGAA